MSFGGFQSDHAPAQPMAEINVTPLVDVMLVLLVIFIITAPLLTYALKLDLPEAKAPPAAINEEPLRLAVDADGRFYLNATAIGIEPLRIELAAAGRRQPAPEVHVRADKAARFEHVATLMSLAQEAGLTRIGFVTEPPTGAIGAPARAPR